MQKNDNSRASAIYYTIVSQNKNLPGINQRNKKHKKRFLSVLIFIFALIMDEELERIIRGAQSLFLQYGLKSNTMDDIARHIGVSKKTVYKHVSNKEDLLQKVLKFHFTQISGALDEISDQSENAIDELLRMDEFMTELGKSQNPTFLYEMQKFYPDSWALVKGWRRDYILKSVVRNLEKGKKDGLFRKELNAELIAMIHLQTIESITDTSVFPIDKYNTEEVMHEYLLYHMHGLVNDKGYDYLKTRIKS